MIELLLLSAKMVISTAMIILPVAILHGKRLMLTGPGLRSTTLIMFSMTELVMQALTMTSGVLLMRLRLRLILLLLLLFLLLLSMISVELLNARNSRCTYFLIFLILVELFWLVGFSLLLLLGC